MSTKEQLKGDSERRQLEMTRRYAKEKNLELIEDYDDYGVSAFRGRNSEQKDLRRFLDAIHAGEISQGSYLIIESMDRLTRQNVITALGLLNQIIENGIIVVTLDNGQEFSAKTFEANQYQLFIAMGAMIRAHEESQRKSGLLSAAWSEKRRQLRDEKKVMTSTVVSWLRADKGKVEVINERVKVVREIFELTCNGYGIYSIARLFNERGEEAWGKPQQTRARRRNSGKVKPIWRDSYIKKIITNRAVLGEFQPHKTHIAEDKKKLRIADGEVIHGYYPQIISPGVFSEAQLAMDRRRNGSKGRKGIAYSNLFTGMLHCVNCGSGMRYLNKGNATKVGKYLRCSRSVSGAECLSKAYRYEVVEEVILSALESLDVEKLLGGPTFSTRLAEKRHEREMGRIDLESVERKIIRINNAILSDEGPTPTSTGAILRGLEANEIEIRAQLNSLDSQIEELLVIDPEKRKAVLDELTRKIRDESDKELMAKARRTLAGELQRMIDVIVIRPDTQFAHEIMEVDDSWKKKFKVNNQSHLERYLHDFGFELGIRYRNGEQQVINGVSRIRLKSKWSKSFRDYRLLARHAS